MRDIRVGDIVVWSAMGKGFAKKFGDGPFIIEEIDNSYPDGAVRFVLRMDGGDIVDDGVVGRVTHVYHAYVELEQFQTAMVRSMGRSIDEN